MKCNGGGAGAYQCQRGVHLRAKLAHKSQGHPPRRNMQRSELAGSHPASQPCMRGRRVPDHVEDGGRGVVAGCYLPQRDVAVGGFFRE